MKIVGHVIFHIRIVFVNHSRTDILCSHVKTFPWIWHLFYKTDGCCRCQRAPGDPRTSYLHWYWFVSSVNGIGIKYSRQSKYVQRVHKNRQRYHVLYISYFQVTFVFIVLRGVLLTSTDYSKHKDTYKWHVGSGLSRTFFFFLFHRTFLSFKRDIYAT